MTAFIQQVKTQSVAAVSKQNSLIEATSADTAANAELPHCRLEERKARRDSERSEEHVDRGWLEEGITLGPLRKGEGFDDRHDQQVADERSVGKQMQAPQ